MRIRDNRTVSLSLVAFFLVLASAVASVTLLDVSDSADIETTAESPSQAGWHRMPGPPVSARLNPALASSLNEVLLFGGIEHDGEGRLAAGGAIFDVAKNSWTPLQSSPAPLLDPAASWVADSQKFVVAGTECASGVEPAVDCRAGSLKVLAFDTEAQEFELLGAYDQYAGPLASLGDVETRALFWQPAEHISGRAPRYFAVNSDSGDLDLLPAPPFAERMEPCRTDTHLIAVSYDFVVDGRLQQEDPALTEGIRLPATGVSNVRVAYFDLAAGNWSDPVPITGEFENPVHPPVCTNDYGALILPQAVVPLDPSTEVEATPIPVPFDDKSLEIYTSVVGATGNDLLMWGLQEEGYRLDVPGRTWAPMEAGPIQAQWTTLQASMATYATFATGPDRQVDRWFRYVPAESRGEGEARYPAERGPEIRPR